MTPLNLIRDPLSLTLKNLIQRYFSVFYPPVSSQMQACNFPNYFLFIWSINKTLSSDTLKKVFHFKIYFQALKKTDEYCIKTFRKIEKLVSGYNFYKIVVAKRKIQFYILCPKFQSFGVYFIIFCVCNVTDFDSSVYFRQIRRWAA